MRTNGLSISLILCLGCSTVPINIETAPRASSQTILDQDFLEKRPGKATIRISRDSGLFGVAAEVFIYIDGRNVAYIEPGTVLVLHVTPGDRRIGMQFGSHAMPIQYVEVKLVPNQTKDFRVSFEGTTRKLTLLN
jgi:hypothetical protein